MDKKKFTMQFVDSKGEVTHEEEVVITSGDKLIFQYSSEVTLHEVSQVWYRLMKAFEAEEASYVAVPDWISVHKVIRFEEE